MNIVNGLYDSKFEKQKAAGYCYYHKKHLTVKMIRAHQCLQKQCTCLKKNDSHEWWAQRARLKAKKKAKKQELKEKYGF